MGSWGGPEGEVKACQNALDRRPTGIISVVSDTYNIHRAIKDLWGGVLADRVRGRNGKVVVRLDSGDPREMVLRALRELGDIFGYERTALGYKVLPPYLGLLQGDGVDTDVMREILHAMAQAEWSAANVVFGSGGALLQKVNRDTHKHAYKASAGYDGKLWWDIYKDPISDHGKRSKRGRLAVVMGDDGWLTAVALTDGVKNHLEQVVSCGKLVKRVSWSEVRARADEEWRRVFYY
jgi:nicotinamide phosphoribosyltransferase